MPVIYGVMASPPTRSAILTAKMVGLDFTLKQVNTLAKEQKSESYMQIAPTHTIPAFEEDNGFRITDSHAIVTYIVSKYAKDDSLYPKDLEKRAVVDSMLHFDNGSLWPSIRGHILLQKLYGKPPNPEREAVFKDKMSILNGILGGRPYVAGDHLTVADICIVNSLTVPMISGVDFTDYPHVTKWVDQLKKDIQYYDEVITAGCEESKKYMALAIERLGGAKSTPT